jgi:glycosyltransferase involved in cell wall biosynthesis
MSSTSPRNGSDGKLYGVLVTFRRPKELANALERICGQSRAPDRLVVVDNSPTSEQRALVNRFSAGPSVTEYVPTEQNAGFAGGVAIGMRHVLEYAADKDWIVVLDDDDPPASATALAELERFARDMFDQDPATAVVGIVGGRFDWRRGRMSRVPDAELTGPVLVDFIGGGHLPLYRVSAIRSQGSFSSDIFFGLSEVEHGLRLRRAGFSIYANGLLWRERREIAGRIGVDAHPSLRLTTMNWRRYYSLRNTIYILRSHHRFGAAVRVSLVQGIGKPLANLPLAPRRAAQHLSLNWRACWDGWRGNMGRRIEPDGLSRHETRLSTDA